MEQNRAPIIAIVGHVDHGKSSLLDYLRKSNIVKKEAGNITQHASSYEYIFKNKAGINKKMTFIDTPGHEIFFNIKEKSSKIADIAILIISLAEGIKTQTKVAIELLAKNKIPFIVALSKKDKYESNTEKVKASLSEAGIFIEDYGGETICQSISSLSGAGVLDLLESIILLSEVLELKADNKKPARGQVLESFIDKNRGITSNLIIKDGILKTGDFLLIDDFSNCKVKILEDFNKKPIKEAAPSAPVFVSGLSKLSDSGLEFRAFRTKTDYDKYFKELSEFNQEIKKEEEKEEFDIEKFLAGDNKQSKILIILKADVINSLEALNSEVQKIENENLEIKIVDRSLGNIAQNDIRKFQDFNETLILGFNVKLEKSAENLSNNFKHINIKTSKVIYELLDYLKDYLKGKSQKAGQSQLQGHGLVLKIFNINKKQILLGLRVEEGTIEFGQILKIKRYKNEIGTATILGMQKVKTKIKSANIGEEIGLLIESKIEIIPKDILIFTRK